MGEMGAADNTQRMGDAEYGLVDNDGRLTLPAPVRHALGIEAGASVAYMVVDGVLVVVPQDQQLGNAIERGMKALAAAGLTVKHVLDELPAVREEIFEELYSEAFRQELERKYRAARGATGDRAS